MTSQQGFQLVIQLLIFPLIFLAGVFFPVDNVPDWLAVDFEAQPADLRGGRDGQIFLDQLPGIGVTIGGRTVTRLEEIAIIGALRTLLLGAAVVAFSRRDWRPSGRR